MKLQRNRIQVNSQNTKEIDLFPETKQNIVSNIVQECEQTEMSKKILREIKQEEELSEDISSVELFEHLFNKYITREGADKLLEYIKETDFYVAPASTKYHGAYQGGLLEHSLHVYHCFNKNIERCSGKYDISFSKESIVLVSLMHDLCKANVYSIEMRNKKIDGKWQQVPVYVFLDEMPLGHGAKSAYLVMNYCNLSPLEYACIAFHMGAFDGDVRKVGEAFQKYPIAYLMSMADQEATYFIENENF